MSVKYFLLPKVQSQYTLKGNQYQCSKFDVEVTTKTSMIIGSTCELLKECTCQDPQYCIHMYMYSNIVTTTCTCMSDIYLFSILYKDKYTPALVVWYFASFSNPDFLKMKLVPMKRLELTANVRPT